MLSLHSRAKDGKSSQCLATEKSKMKKKLTLMDLDTDNDDNKADEAFLLKEAKFLKLLEKSLTCCELCGPTKHCQISRAGEHINLSFQQRWG